MIREITTSLPDEDFKRKKTQLIFLAYFTLHEFKWRLDLISMKHLDHLRPQLDFIMQKSLENIAKFGLRLHIWGNKYIIIENI